MAWIDMHRDWLVAAVSGTAGGLFAILLSELAERCGDWIGAALARVSGRSVRRPA